MAKGSITSFVCDPTTNGFSASVNETDYVLDQDGHQVTEMGSGLNGSMAWAHTNVWAGGQLLATYSAVLDPPCQQDGTNCQPNCAQPGQSCQDGALHFYLNDWVGTRRVQTDYAGIQEQDCSSLPFGENLNCTQSIDGPTEHHFTGKERDAESGNDYFGARYYNSNMGRFLSPDPQGNSYADYSNPQTWNMYSYVLNNPLSFVDPTGLYCDYSDHDDPQSGFDPSQFDYHSNSDECKTAGGQWVDDAYTHGGFDDAGRPDYAVATNTQASNSPQPTVDDAWQDLQTTIPGIEVDVTNWILSTYLPSQLGGRTNSFSGQDPFRLFGTHHCGPGGAGATVGALDAACKVHDACYAAAPGGGISPANNYDPSQPMTSAQAAQAKQCNQALYDAARGHPDVPGSKAVQWWTVNGSNLPGGAYILYPGTEAVPW